MKRFVNLLTILNRHTVLLFVFASALTATGFFGFRSAAQERSTATAGIGDERGKRNIAETMVPLVFDTTDLLFRLPAFGGKTCPIQDIGAAGKIVSAPQAEAKGGDANAMAPVIIYDTTHASTQGAEITAAANGAATTMGDLIVLDGTNRFVTNVQIQVFTLASTAPFDLTMRFYTDCSTSGAGNSPCGNGTGTLIPGSTRTVTGITPGALGTIFNVDFPYPATLNLTGEVDNTVSVTVTASRSDVFWRLGEAATVGTSTNVVERCGSAAANNGCARNFGVPNNFAITITADNVATAAGVNISGRVLSSAGGRGLTGAVVRLTDQNGGVQTVVTGRLGTFAFGDVEPGQTYVISVVSRRFNFAPRVIQVADNVTDLEFAPE